MPFINDGDPFKVRSTEAIGAEKVEIFRLDRLEIAGQTSLEKLPYSIRVLLENLLRHCDGELVTQDDVAAVARWQAVDLPAREIPFMPARVILQDFTGVPAVVDLAALRAALARWGGKAEDINPLIPVDLVIDHSVQVDAFGTEYSLGENVAKEYQRNQERYGFLKWAQAAFDDLRVVPPGTGIIHQVNLEYLANLVQVQEENGRKVAFPDTLVGTDSHTVMINGLGVLGWGVGGIEAEATMLGQPYSMMLPEVIGCRLEGELPPGATATDLVLTVTEALRRRGVVEKFVEFFGPGVAQLSLPDRATVANMGPEYGATLGYFPVDEETISFLRATGRSEKVVQLVEGYYRAQGLFRSSNAPEPSYTDVVSVDLSTVEPSLAGPRRPQDRVSVSGLKNSFQEQLTGFFGKSASSEPTEDLHDGSVVIAAITSCTNTSNPSVMLGAGLVAKKAVERGLQVKPYVKTSLTPGSRVVTQYLEKAGLLPYLEALRFHVAGYGCATCIGNSGTLPPAVAKEVEERDLVAAAVVSGNRNFEGRINPLVKANYLASPMLVVAYALAGKVDIDLETEPLGHDPNGKAVYLKDIWPAPQEIAAAVKGSVEPAMFDCYNQPGVAAEWEQLAIPDGSLYAWDKNSTYLQEPPFFTDLGLEPEPVSTITRARALVVVGDSITTDHISPAGAIPSDSPAAAYLREHGISAADFNTYGSRRGNHEVMMRGTFGNIRLRNALVEREGGWTVHLPSGREMSIFDAAMTYKAEQTPLIVVAGKEYGTGSSRDWAAKGPFLLGVKAVLAESYERIHRSNLVGMGVLPLQFISGDSRKTLGITGHEVFSVLDLSDDIKPRQEVRVLVEREDGKVNEFKAIVRLDSQVEINYYRNGGILQTVLRRIARETRGDEAAS